MQFNTSFILASFLAFITGVHSANLVLYEQQAQGCTKNDPGDNLIRNVRYNTCIQLLNNQNNNPSGPYRTVHGINLRRGDRLEVFSDTRCTRSSSITSGQENQGEAWATVEGSNNKLIRSVLVLSNNNQNPNPNQDQDQDQ